jgi:hypothetical protein
MLWDINLAKHFAKHLAKRLAKPARRRFQLQGVAKNLKNFDL